MPIALFRTYILPGAAPVIRKLAKVARDTVASALARASIAEQDRRKLRVNAASWQQRAQLLQRLLASFNKREALDQAERERADAADRLFKTNGSQQHHAPALDRRRSKEIPNVYKA